MLTDNPPIKRALYYRKAGKRTMVSRIMDAIDVLLGRNEVIDGTKHGVQLDMYERIAPARLGAMTDLNEATSPLQRIYCSPGFQPFEKGVLYSDDKIYGERPKGTPTL